jgi:hypothetical protein
MSARYVLPTDVPVDVLRAFVDRLAGRYVDIRDLLNELKSICIEVNSNPSDEMIAEMTQAFHDFHGNAEESMRAAYKVAHLWSPTAKSQQAIDTLIELGYTHSSGQWIAPDPAPKPAPRPMEARRWMVKSCPGHALLMLKDGTTEAQARERAQNGAAQHGWAEVHAVVARYERRTEVVEVKA